MATCLGFQRPVPIKPGYTQLPWNVNKVSKSHFVRRDQKQSEGWP
jgi:hypothetical protein